MWEYRHNVCRIEVGSAVVLIQLRPAKIDTRLVVGCFIRSLRLRRFEVCKDEVYYSEDVV
jgi:hypothetical protein